MPSRHARHWLTLAGKLQQLVMLEPAAAHVLESIVDKMLEELEKN